MKINCATAPLKKSIAVVLALCMAVLPLLNCGGGSSLSSPGTNSPQPPPPRGVTWTTTCNFTAILAAKGSDTICTYVINGESITRSVLFHPGTHYVVGNAAVMYLHSSCGGVQEFKNPNIQWDVMANQKAILVVSPLGAAPQPNPGACKWNSWWTPWDTTVPPDDGAFIRALLLDTSNRLGADPQKRFITGWSAGSDLISRILVTSGDLVKAAAVVEGHWTGFDDLDTPCGSTVPCTGKFIPPMPTPVNVMIIRGENGAMRICSSNSHESTVDEEFTYYTAQNRTTTVMPNTNKFCPSDTRGSTAGTETWKKATGGTNGTVVKIFELLGGGHQWYASNICSAAGVHNSQFAVEFPNACPVANGGNGGTGFENAIVYEFFMQSSH